MSLDWNIGNIKNYEEIAEGGPEWDTTEDIIFRTMAVGIGEITEENAEFFFVRVRMIEDVFGLNDEGDDHITLADITRRIGLKTNVSPLTNAQFDKKIAHEIRRKANWHLDEQKKEMEKALA